MRWLVGLILVSVDCLAAPALAQLPPAGEPPIPPPPPASAPAPAPAATPPAATAAPPIDSATQPSSTPAPVDLTQGATPPPAAPATVAGPPPPPPRDHDARVPRQRRPFYIAGELGWNGLSGLGVNFGYHPEPHFAIDTGLGLSLTGLRIGARLRANLMTGEWTPFLSAGFSYAGGSGNQSIDFESKGEKAKGKVLGSPFVQLGGGVNYTGSEGFMFTFATGYSILARKGSNTRYISGAREAYDDIRPIFGGGLILSVAFGYAF